MLDHPTSWQRHYDLTLDLATGAAEAAFLRTDFHTMERWITAVLQGARTLLDTIPVYRVHLQACLAQNQFTASLEMAFRVLQHLGIDVATLEDPAHLPAVMHETHTALAGKSLQELLELPEMTDPSQRAAVDILSHLISPSYIAAQPVFRVIVCTMVQLSIAGGYNPFTAYAYALYGQLLCSRTHDIATAGQFGTLALKLLARAPAGHMTSKVYVMVYVYILPWTEALTHTLQPLLAAYHGGLEHGDFESARVAAFFYCIHHYFLGTELPTVEREIATYRQAISQLQPGPSQAYMDIWHQAVLNLLGHATEPWRFAGAVCVARLYLQAAYRGYLQWGAASKVQQMEARYATYVAPDKSWPTPAASPGDGSTEATVVTGGTLDLATTLKAAQALSSAITLPRLLETMMAIVIEHAGAQRGVFLREQDSQLLLVARSEVAQHGTTILAPAPLASCEEVSQGIIHYVQRTGEAVVIDDAGRDAWFTADPYLLLHKPKSISCIPIINRTHLLGIVYLENTLTTHAFTAQRLELLQVLAAQLAISFENARAHEALQQEIANHKQAEQALHKALTEVAQLQERLQAENSYLREEIRRDANFEEIVGHSPALRKVLHQVERVAVTDTTVLILGETGTGKELIARAIHSRSPRQDRPLVKVNCAAFVDQQTVWKTSFCHKIEGHLH